MPLANIRPSPGHGGGVLFDVGCGRVGAIQFGLHRLVGLESQVRLLHVLHGRNTALGCVSQENASGYFFSVFISFLAAGALAGALAISDFGCQNDGSAFATLSDT